MDNERIKFKKDLHPLYLPVYLEICNSLDSKWVPTSGYRSIEHQNVLYQQGRGTKGNIVTNAKGGESAHNYGCATDWTVLKDGKKIWPDIKDPIWEEYEFACARAGAYWGGLFNDYPHNQLCIKISWKQVGKILVDKGLSFANQAIKDCLV